MFSMANFIKSAALPWMTVLIAVRSGSVRCRDDGITRFGNRDIAHAFDLAAGGPEWLSRILAYDIRPEFFAETFSTPG